MIDVGKELAPPELLKPSATNPHEGSYITSVAWNKSVSHILASAGSDGLICLLYTSFSNPCHCYLHLSSPYAETIYSQV